MKFCVAPLALLLPSSICNVLVASAQEEVKVTNSLGCINLADFPADTDFFKDKVEPGPSEFWNITYHKTYKILMNEYDGESYLLYQCGTEIPASEQNAGHNAIIEVPIQDGVALASTVEIPYLELLGLRPHIQGYLGAYSSFIVSPCVKEMIATNETIVVPNITNPVDVDRLLTSDGTGENIVAFGGSDLFKNSIKFTQWTEATNLGVLGWIKFVSTFFNLEAIANHEYDEIEERFDCIRQNAEAVLSDKPKPTMIWARYVDWNDQDQFDVGLCPNYYCEIASICSADLRWDTTQFMNISDFVEFAKDAEYWVYPDMNWEVAYGKYKDQLDTFVSVQNKEVYDLPSSGYPSWFEERFVEPDAVVEDVCTIVGTTEANFHQRAYFRNAFNDDLEQLPEKCEDTTARFQTSASVCTVTLSNSQNGESSAPSTVMGVLSVIVLAISTYFNV